MKYLGVDFGERWVGLAYSDPMGMFASPGESLRVKSLEEAVTRTAAAAREAEAEKVIVGHARDLSGKRGTKAQKGETKRLLSKTHQHFMGLIIKQGVTLSGLIGHARSSSFAVKA